MIKRQEKGLALALILAAAGLFVICGFLGWTANWIPLHYIGYALGAYGLAGLAGANIWFGPFAIEPEDQNHEQPRAT
jgi:hypothetical protein